MVSGHIYTSQAYCTTKWYDHQYPHKNIKEYDTVDTELCTVNYRSWLLIRFEMIVFAPMGRLCTNAHKQGSQ